MKLTIIVDDGCVHVNDAFLIRLNLSNTGIPPNIHALQWDDSRINKGWIEYKDTPEGFKPNNESIDALPSWANACITEFETQMEVFVAQQNAMTDKNQPLTSGTQVI